MIRRMAGVLQREGMRGIARRLVERTVRPLIWVERIGFYDSDLPDLPAQAMRGFPAEVRPARPDELLQRFSRPLEDDFGVTPDDAAQRIAREHVTVIAVHEGQLIGMLWLAFNGQRVSEVGREMKLRPGEFLTYNESTLPAWRGRGVSPCMNRCAEGFARRHSAARRITWRRLGNTAAVRVAAKLHDRLFAVVTTVRLLAHDHAIVLGLRNAALPALVSSDKEPRGSV